MVRYVQEANAGKGRWVGPPPVQGQVLRDRPEQDSGGVHQIPYLPPGQLGQL